MGQPHSYNLVVQVSDGMFTDTAKVDIIVLDVNQNQPTFINPSSQNATVYIPEVGKKIFYLVGFLIVEFLVQMI